MTVPELLGLLRQCPLIASAQASPGAAVDDPATLAKLAATSLGEGVTVLRAQGVENLKSISALGAPVVGLIKRDYPDCAVYITPTVREVDEVIDAGCAIVAIDGTGRSRPGGVTFGELVAHAHSRGALVLADIDTVVSAKASVAAGADLVSTTLAGYTEDRPASKGPDLDLLRQVVAECKVPVLAEGRFGQRWQVEAAVRIGAAGVVIGGAINDPLKNTRSLKPRVTNGKVGAVDLGGTWMRFGVFNSDWKLESLEKMPLLEAREDRLDWIRKQVKATGVERVGVGTGGVVDPNSGELWEAKAIIPDHVGSIFSEETLGVPTIALNDGLATAWGHACLPQFVGKRVATLALGTGVGCGFVSEGRIWMGTRGEYPRLNDQPTPNGYPLEALLGGAALSPNPTDEQKADAVKAFLQAALTIQEMYFPEEIVVCGGVGLSPWLSPFLQGKGISATPLGHDAGLYGAAALALFPPDLP